MRVASRHHLEGILDDRMVVVLGVERAAEPVTPVAREVDAEHLAGTPRRAGIPQRPASPVLRHGLGRGGHDPEDDLSGLVHRGRDVDEAEPQAHDTVPRVAEQIDARQIVLRVPAPVALCHPGEPSFLVSYPHIRLERPQDVRVLRHAAVPDYSITRGDLARDRVGVPFTHDVVERAQRKRKGELQVQRVHRQSFGFPQRHPVQDPAIVLHGDADSRGQLSHPQRC